MIRLVMDGKVYEISDECAHKIRKEMLESAEANPFEFVAELAPYYFINQKGEAACGFDTGDIALDRYNTGNYCRDKAMIEQRALNETLNRLLWRYSEERGFNCKPWDMRYQHWCIGSLGGKPEIIRSQGNHCFGPVYFDRYEYAQEAIRDVVKPFLDSHPDFVW